MVTATQSIREIVAGQSSAAAILQRFDIDLCSRAGETLNSACSELQLSVDQVLEKLAEAAALEGGTQVVDFSGYSPGRLIQHIVRAHHQYVRRELPRLAAMARTLTRKYGDRAPELRQVESTLDELRAEMFAHLEKEEQILFPFIAEMDQQPAAGSRPAGCFSALTQPVSMMIMEHASAELLVAAIRDLTGGFTPPETACPTHIALFAGLREFAADLRQHVHLENDLLFPCAIDLEAELNSRR
jgi:regulator of cell morphogenesis and NO signaling